MQAKYHVEKHHMRYIGKGQTEWGSSFHLFKERPSDPIAQINGSDNYISMGKYGSIDSLALQIGRDYSSFFGSDNNDLNGYVISSGNRKKRESGNNATGIVSRNDKVMGLEPLGLEPNEMMDLIDKVEEIISVKEKQYERAHS